MVATSLWQKEWVPFPSVVKKAKPEIPSSSYPAIMETDNLSPIVSLGIAKQITEA